jgi:predicted SprT family Zn-dependent metalloprotease
MQTKNISQNPTQQFYEFLQDAYEFFNKELFVKSSGSKLLPNCIITMQREKRTMGYFSQNRWIDKNGNKTHEIALNPAYFASHNVIEIFQTLVHEMCHLWQCEFGKRDKTKARTYHDKEWVDKMQQIGINAISASSNNGTGQKVGDEPIKNGVFEVTCIEFVNLGNQIKWIDRFPAVNICNSHNQTTNTKEKRDNAVNYLYTNLSEIITGVKTYSEVKAAAKHKHKSTYECPDCKNKLWGRAGINVVCGECHIAFSEV